MSTIKRDAADIIAEEGPAALREAFDRAAEQQRNGGSNWEPVDCVPDDCGSGGTAPQQPLKMFSKAEFVEGFVPPDYVVVGVLQRRFIYSLTGQTSHAKTAIGLLIAELVGSNAPATAILSHKIKKGNVFY